ncbi:MAG: ribosome biogenesis GTPase Der [Myxococcota bacterium]|nr:ribosome biogenesis GTPase Der [Myxococcota bacterium]
MSDRSIPIVAILGRPNVGKSTLFNRFAGRRRALVEDTPGVTRDRLAEEVDVSGRPVLVVDTAGLDPEPESAIEAAVQAQARTAIEEADAILFVVDGQAGLLPEEEEIARMLRRGGQPVALAVNKVDHPKHQHRVGEFHALGLDLVRGISAEHGSGAWDLLEELVEQLGEPGERPATDEATRVAIVGRPNVGKSSLLNRLVGEERVVVSDVPGTTRDAIDIRLEHEGQAYVFVDTAGIRRPGSRRRVGEQGAALMAVRAIERASVALVLVDASEGFTDQDARVLSLVRERGCAGAVLVNKWDLAEREDEGFRRRLRDELERRLRGLSDVPLLRISAQTGKGVARIFPLITKLAEAGGVEIPTAELNRWLRDAVARHEPAMAQRGARKRPLKFFYATQVGTRPPTFVLFCTEPNAVQGSYLRFLENRLREQFDLGGAPVRLILRKRRSEDEDG